MGHKDFKNKKITNSNMQDGMIVIDDQGHDFKQEMRNKGAYLRGFAIPAQLLGF